MRIIREKNSLMLHCNRIKENNELKAKINPPNFHLMTFLNGDKIILKTSQNYFLILMLYLEYFFSLISFWDYMPTDSQIKDMKNFIIKYYKDDFLVKIFNKAVSFNKAFFKKFNKTI